MAVGLLACIARSGLKVRSSSAACRRGAGGAVSGTFPHHKPAPALSWEAASIISVREVHQLRPAVKEETMTPSFRLLALLLLLLSPRDGFGMAIGRFTRPPPKAQQQAAAAAAERENSFVWALPSWTAKPESPSATTKALKKKPVKKVAKIKVARGASTPDSGLPVGKIAAEFVEQLAAEAVVSLSSDDDLANSSALAVDQATNATANAVGVTAAAVVGANMAWSVIKGLFVGAATTAVAPTAKALLLPFSIVAIADEGEEARAARKARQQKRAADEAALAATDAVMERATLSAVDTLEADFERAANRADPLEVEAELLELEPPLSPQAPIRVATRDLGGTSTAVALKRRAPKLPKAARRTRNLSYGAVTLGGLCTAGYLGAAWPLAPTVGGVALVRNLAKRAARGGKAADE